MLMACEYCGSPAAYHADGTDETGLRFFCSPGHAPESLQGKLREVLVIPSLGEIHHAVEPMDPGFAKLFTSLGVPKQYLGDRPGVHRLEPTTLALSQQGMKLFERAHRRKRGS